MRQNRSNRVRIREEASRAELGDVCCEMSRSDFAHLYTCTATSDLTPPWKGEGEWTQLQLPSDTGGGPCRDSLSMLDLVLPHWSLKQI